MKDLPQLIYYILLVVLLLSAFIRYRYYRSLAVWTSIGVWSVIILFISGVYVYRDVAINLKNHILANLVPGYIVTEPNKMTVAAAKDGHFYVYVTMGNKNVKEVTTKFMIDTGASSVVIPLELAKDIGIDIDALQFVYATSTANGQTMAARSMVKKIQVGEFMMRDFPVLIIHSELQIPLLGLDFLQTLKSYKFEDDRMVMELPTHR
ncbi:TIGR02281 family clan AA aspartic protease [Rickettsiales endosymbiont of Peranema trichophorum]|uniref:retropepsin-like aspartic protease family protein n=1 Tax=Rickettsiales endosymbiont of Peranema trichophorum TaxID=2486577 RepID=UPI001023647B|nr:TIGR02281 family clan AA aspartic protease [Rickettsiales endosymbiont of Peranema trichophorum]RZI47533.1 TIGR02281 family clan AA aspartic protease [Rickettsiales endosymbiont of Peranema trichophorum]